MLEVKLDRFLWLLVERRVKSQHASVHERRRVRFHCHGLARVPCKFYLDVRDLRPETVRTPDRAVRGRARADLKYLFPVEVARPFGGCGRHRAIFVRDQHTRNRLRSRPRAAVRDTERDDPAIDRACV